MLGTGADPQGSGHSSKHNQVQEGFKQCSWALGVILGVSCTRATSYDSMILMDPYDSVIPGLLYVILSKHSLFCIIIYEVTQEIGYQNQASSDRASLAKGNATCHFYLHKSATGQQLQLIIFRKNPSMQKYLWGKTLQTCNKWATQLQPQLTDPLAKAEKNSCIKVHLYCHEAGEWGPTNREHLHTM